MKYRQPGYRDGDYKERRDRERREERDARQEARKTRHGVSRDANAVIRCADCGYQPEGEITIGRDTLCGRCGTSLHNCRNCRHFDTGARFQCKQPIPERLPSKTAANDCSYYEPRLVLDATGKRAKGPENPRTAFDNLFKK